MQNGPSINVFTLRPPAASTLCATKLSAQWYGDWNDFHGENLCQPLGEAAQQIGLDVPVNLHAASADAALTRRLLT